MRRSERAAGRRCRQLERRGGRQGQRIEALFEDLGDSGSAQIAEVHRPLAGGLCAEHGDPFEFEHDRLNFAQLAQHWIGVVDGSDVALNRLTEDRGPVEPMIDGPVSQIAPMLGEMGVLGAPAPFAAALVRGQALLVEIDHDARRRRADPDGLAKMRPRNGVESAIEVHVAVAVDGRLVPEHDLVRRRRQTQQGWFLLDEGPQRLSPSRSVNPETGDPLDPIGQLRVRLVERRERASRQEVVLDVLHARLHLALGLRGTAATDRSGSRSAEPAPGSFG